jgi:hypothetical protein
LTNSCPRTGWIQQKKNKIAINFFPYNKSFALILNVAGRMLTQEAKDWIKEAYKTEIDYRKYVFGEITHVWVKK